MEGLFQPGWNFRGQSREEPAGRGALPSPLAMRSVHSRFVRERSSEGEDFCTRSNAGEPHLCDVLQQRQLGGRWRHVRLPVPWRPHRAAPPPVPAQCYVRRWSQTLRCAASSAPCGRQVSAVLQSLVQVHGMGSAGAGEKLASRPHPHAAPLPLSKSWPSVASMRSCPPRGTSLSGALGGQ